MRPIKIVLNGINSFSESQELRFDELENLFCVCGPTGSGKTTILDGILLALYGKCGRGDVQTDLINTKCDEACVSFDFVCENVPYSVTRRFRRKKKSRTESTSFAELYADGKIVSEEVREVNARIEEIVGLSFEDFTQVIALKQGQFDRFLKSGMTERSRTVSKLCHLEKYANLSDKAKVRLAACEANLGIYRDRIKNCEKFTAEYLSALADKAAEAENNRKNSEKELELAEKRLSELNEVKQRRQKSDEAKRLLAEYGVEAEAISKRIAEYAVNFGEEAERRQQQAKELLRSRENALSELRAKLPFAEERRKALSAVEKQRIRYREKSEEKKACETRAFELKRNRDASEQRREELAAISAKFSDKERTVGEVALVAESCLRSMEEKRAAEEACGVFERAKIQAATELEKSKEREKQCEADVALAEAELQKARAEYEKSLLNNSAAALAERLEEGDTCPVCGGTIKARMDSASSDERAAETARAEAAVKHCEAAKRQADAAHRAAQTSLAKAETELKSATERLEEKRKAVAKAEADILALGVNAAEAASAKKAAAELLKIDEILRANESELIKSTGIIGALQKECEAIAESGKAEKARAEEYDELLGKRTDAQLEAEIAALSAETTALDRQTREYEKAKESAAAAAKKDEQRLTALDTLREKARADAAEVPFDEAEYNGAVADKESLRKRLMEEAAALGGLTAELKNAKIGREQLLQAKKECSELQSEYDKLYELKKLFEKERFLEYVAEGYVRRFAETASEILSDITVGKYTLKYGEDGKFCVEDFNSGGVRAISTLSGGETFLTSLALALAVTREISRGRTYEFFFLDEGFGTLDENTLDLVADALAALSREVKVGLITHCRELTERIASKVDVSPANDSRGSRIEQ